MGIILSNAEKPAPKHGIRRQISNTNEGVTHKRENLTKDARNKSAKSAVETTTNGNSDSSINDVEQHPLKETLHFNVIPTKPEINGNNSNVEMEVSHDEETNGMMNSPFRGVSLKDFEKHQKMLEEQNREKMRILQTTIEKW